MRTCNWCGGVIRRGDFCSPICRTKFVAAADFLELIERQSIGNEGSTDSAPLADRVPTVDLGQ